MIFTTWVFAVFLLTSLAVYWAVPVGWRKPVLILAGCVFYIYSVPKYLFLIIGLSVIVYLAGLWILNANRCKSFFTPRRVMILGVLVPALVLFVFKYLRLAINTLNQVIGYFSWGPPLPVISFMVPLGISFFVFEFIHYLVDLYKGKIDPGSLNLGNFLTFTLYFPTLVCGPIKRYQQFSQQLGEGAAFALDGALEGMRRIITGFGKKLILADTFSLLTGVLATPESAGGAALAVGAYAYTMKIYFDFSGYSDIAIGTSLLFGLKVPENFDRPYLSRNVAEFWRRWHMSLSSWIRDYLFIPLGGSRVNRGRNLFNLMVAMGICGMWHGAAWNFLAWGLYHGAGLGVHRLFRVYIGDRFKLPTPVAVFLTFHFVVVGWIFFSAPNLTKALVTIHKIFFAWIGG